MQAQDPQSDEPQPGCPRPRLEAVILLLAPGVGVLLLAAILCPIAQLLFAPLARLCLLGWLPLW